MGGAAPRRRAIRAVSHRAVMDTAAIAIGSASGQASPAPDGAPVATSGWGCPDLATVIPSKMRIEANLGCVCHIFAPVSFHCITSAA